LSLARRFSFYGPGAPRHLHSFPTRRSSDLRCRAIWSSNLGFTTVLGFPTDVESVELLYTSLLVQATAAMVRGGPQRGRGGAQRGDRKSTRLNSSHVKISYAVFCLKKKKTTK